MIHVAFNIDHTYVRHCGVTLVSIFENNPGETFHIHILERGLEPSDEQTLTHIVKQHRSCISFYTPKEEMLQGLVIRKFSKRISMATYFRCFLSELLPHNIDRVLYLDCDMVVLGSLRPLWEKPLKDLAAAVVEDIGCYEPERYERLCYPMRDGYFNAGMMLVNLEYWRQNDIPGACLRYFRAHPERIIFNDQDLLNAVLHDSTTYVGLEWNVQDGFYRLPRTLSDEWRAKFADVLKRPVILHFTNRKPWDYDSQHPLREIYFYYLCHSPWKDLCRSTPAMRLKRFFRLLPFRLHMRRPKYVRLSDI